MAVCGLLVHDFLQDVLWLISVSCLGPTVGEPQRHVYYLWGEGGVLWGSPPAWLFTAPSVSPPPSGDLATPRYPLPRASWGGGIYLLGLAGKWSGVPVRSHPGGWLFRPRH